MASSEGADSASAGVSDIGDFTPAFDALVRVFQARTKQTIDGVIGRGTWGAIWAFSDVPEDEPTFLAQRKTVRKGQFSGDVAKAQILIDGILAGSRAPAPFRAIDDIGDFTPRFDALVRLFQARTRQGIDGVVGRRTWSMLFLLSTMGTERERDEIPVGG